MRQYAGLRLSCSQTSRDLRSRDSNFVRGLWIARWIGSSMRPWRAVTSKRCDRWQNTTESLPSPALVQVLSMLPSAGSAGLPLQDVMTPPTASYLMICPQTPCTAPHQGLTLTLTLTPDPGP